MAEKTLNTRIQQKHDIEANWLKAVNFIPKVGEVIVYDIDETHTTPRMKIGDGVKNVNELEFIGEAAATPDWNASEGEPGYIENRPFYSEMVENTNIMLANTTSGNGDIRRILENNTYVVTWDGMDYTCTAYRHDENFIILGNGFYYDENNAANTGEPFAIVCNNYGRYTVYSDGIPEAGFSVRYDYIVEEIKKINSKYLPIGAEGSGTNAEIFNDYKNNTASGFSSHAEGSNTSAKGYASHAEGANTEAHSVCSHAEGSSTAASGEGSHAEGDSTIAEGEYSHAEGFYSVTYGEASHAEGRETTASGGHSHAEGSSTAASGEGSHAEGFGTIASGENSHVQGKFNLEDAENKYAHIVGNGISGPVTGTVRSNAHTLDWSGNAWFSGDVYVGSTSGTNKDEGSQKLVTMAELQAAIPDSTEIVAITTDEINEICGTVLYTENAEVL